MTTLKMPYQHGYLAMPPAYTTNIHFNPFNPFTTTQFAADGITPHSYNQACFYQSQGFNWAGQNMYQMCPPPPSLSSSSSPAMSTASVGPVTPIKTSPVMTHSRPHYGQTSLQGTRLKTHNQYRISKGPRRPLPSSRQDTCRISKTSSQPSHQTIDHDIPNIKDIAPIQPQDPSKQIEFHTGIDQLMRVLESNTRNSPEDTLPTPASSPKPKPESPLSVCPSDSDGQRSQPERTFRCNGPSCTQVFTQKGHLNIHMRTHTGEKPFQCDYPGCEQRFSQLGNMKTHKRRHENHRPFQCTTCSKTFVQQSIMRAHEKVHAEDRKSYPCILDGCKKEFVSRGNLKHHQNSYHAGAIRDLSRRFEKYAGQGHFPTEDRALLEYFKSHYKNSNKGVKGRGKARFVSSTEGQSKANKRSSRKAAIFSKHISSVVDSPVSSPESTTQYDSSPSPVSLYGQAPQSQDLSTIFVDMNLGPAMMNFPYYTGYGQSYSQSYRSLGS